MVDATISRPGWAVWRVWAAQVPAGTPLTRRARGHVRFTPSAAHRYRHVSASGCRRAPDGQPTPRACDLMASTISRTGRIPRPGRGTRSPQFGPGAPPAGTGPLPLGAAEQGPQVRAARGGGAQPNAGVWWGAA